MKLFEISSKDKMVQAILMKMALFAPFLFLLDFSKIVGNAEAKRKSPGTKAGTKRAINNNYTGKLAEVVYENMPLKIYGDDVEVDVANERRQIDVDSVRYEEIMAFAENLGKTLQYDLINGNPTSDALEIAGLRTLCKNARKINMGDPAAGVEVPLGNSAAEKKAQQKFVEKLRELIGMIPGGAEGLVMDTITHSRFSSIASDFVKYEKNEYGILLPYFDSVPIIKAGTDADGNKAITHTETFGTSTTCTSVFAFRSGLKNFAAGTNTGVNHTYKGIVGNVHIDTIEIDITTGLLNDEAIAQLQGVIIP